MSLKQVFHPIRQLEEVLFLVLQLNRIYPDSEAVLCELFRDRNCRKSRNAGEEIVCWEALLPLDDEVFFGRSFDHGGGGVERQET